MFYFFLTQPTYDTGTGSRTLATLVGGEHSHHSANPAPLKCVVQAGPISVIKLKKHYKNL